MPRQRPASDPMQGGERRHLTVMFCDLVGSTALSNSLDPEDLSLLIQNWSDEASRAIRDQGGYVARFMGDGILSYFGYPQAFEDNAPRSVRAAQAVLEATKAVAQKHGIDLKTRVGIASGETVTGHLAEADGGIETLAIGQTPNLAARLEGVAEPGTIVVAATTARLLRGGWLCEPLGPQTLKGFSGPEDAWRVVDVAQKLSAEDADRATFVLRDDEIEELQHLWERVSNHKGQAVHLVGEAGIGKSTLAAEFISNLPTDAKCIRLACHAARQGRAFGPVIDHFGSLIEAAGPEHTNIEQVMDVIRLNLPASVSRDEVMLRSMFDLVFPDAEIASTASAADRRGILLSTLTSWITDSSSEQPLLLLVEDLHWADVSTLDWLERLTQALKTLPLMILATSRPGVEVHWEPSAHIHSLELGRLPASAGKAIIAGLSQGHALPTEIVELIIDRTDGIPLFLEEMTREVLETGMLEKTQTGWRLLGSVEDVGIPNSLQDLLMARLDKNPVVRSVAQVASVLGRQFTQNQLREVSERSIEQVTTALSSLETDKLVRQLDATAGRWVFRHALVRDAAYESLLRSNRVSLHQRCADVFETSHPDIGNREPERLAWHLGQAGQHNRASELWQQAASNARATWANAEAYDYLARALKHANYLEDSEQRQTTRLDLQLELGEVSRSVNGSSSTQTLVAFRDAAALAIEVEDNKRLLNALYGEFIGSFTAAKLDDAMAICDQLEDVAQILGSSEGEVASAQARGMHAFATGQFDTARSALEAALQYGEGKEMPGSFQFPVTTQSYLCWTLYFLGDASSAQTLLRDALESMHDGPGYDLALLLGNGCYLYQFDNQPESVRDLAQKLDDLACERHLPSWRSVAEFFAAYAACALNPSKDELTRLTHALRAWDVDEIETPYFKCIVAERLLAAGQVAEAHELATDALEGMQNTGEVWYRTQCEALLQQMIKERSHASSV